MKPLIKVQTIILPIFLGILTISTTRCTTTYSNSIKVGVFEVNVTHPMSHYGKGDVSSDFVGIARDTRQNQLGLPHIYFTGAGGNIAAGKYNDGSPETRTVLAGRMEKAMQQAWEQTKKVPLTKSDVDWRNVETALPLAKHLVEDEFITILADEQMDPDKKFAAAVQLAWLRRTKAGHTVNISALKLANVYLLKLLTVRVDMSPVNGPHLLLLK